MTFTFILLVLLAVAVFELIAVVGTLAWLLVKRESRAPRMRSGTKRRRPPACKR